MTTMKEDYVSFETAKLLKEKGFGFNSCSTYYTLHGEVCEIGKSQEIGIAPRPTLQMAMMWLRDVHNFSVNTELNIHGYFCSLSHIVRDLSGYIIDIEDSEAWETAYYDSYEEACEDAIKYCLENLI